MHSLEDFYPKLYSSKRNN